MARIRTIKPEAFASESLAQVSVSAERTFFGLLTQADDHGRFRDQAAVIAGLLWSLRPGHGPMGVEDDLAQLTGAELICRYEGEDGKRYLHIVTWSRHQKINRPSGVRHPACPHHDGPPRRSEPSPASQGAVTAPSSPPHGGLTDGSREKREPSVKHDEAAGQTGFSEPSTRARGGLGEPGVSPHGPDLGPRIMDLGSVPVGAAGGPAPNTVSAQQLTGEFVAACAHRPPEKLLGHLGREVNQLLGEGIAPDHIRAGLARLRTKGLSPSVLPSLVNEAMNAGPPAARAAHRPWTNPADVESAYGGDL
ncbi:hypothetical protein ACFYWU_12320 [Streptomyces chrestomyceticus]|uniref:hypothetical protein n=1 Tax=Streptomyces chrestomyceticus TaxID=68185 RepID=UPI0036B62A8A